MAELKTKQTDVSVNEFILNHVDSEQKKSDSFELIKIMQQLTGHLPKMWGPSMIGFGSYHYKSQRSTQEGDWPLIGFSPRKAALSLYVYAGLPEQDEMLSRLGKFKRGKGCLYVKKLSDVDLDVLGLIMRATVDHLRGLY